jgi:hypothetical protein
LAKELKEEGVDLALLDLWAVMMKQAGWQSGQSKLPGSRELPENMVLKLMLHDGKTCTFVSLARADTLTGLHFNNLAYTVYFTEIMKTIQQTWPDQLPNDKNIPYLFPAWDNNKVWKEKNLEYFQ